MHNSQNLDGAGGFLKELLSKPSFKDDVRAILKSLEGPDVGRQGVKTFLWQDFEFSQGILSSLPALANVLVRILDELLVQLDDKFSPLLLHGYLQALADDFDQEGLVRLRKDLSSLVERLIPQFSAAPDLKALIVQVGPVLVARGINIAAVNIKTLCREEPAIISTFLARTIENIDKPTLNDAALNLADAILDQKLGLMTLFGGLLKRRGARLLKRFGLARQGGRP